MHRWVLSGWYIFIFAFYLALPAYSDSIKVLPGQIFTLHVGHQAKFDDTITIIFKSVVKDTRCPINVTCMWAGNGKVKLEILNTEGSSKTVILNTEFEPRVKTLYNFQLQLLALDPPKVDGVKIADEEYSITLQISKNAME